MQFINQYVNIRQSLMLLNLTTKRWGRVEFVSGTSIPILASTVSTHQYNLS